MTSKIRPLSYITGIQMTNLSNKGCNKSSFLNSLNLY
jgi:hypothetical protein